SPESSMAVTHRSVVGPGGSTPQRRVIGGSPHAREAWVVVFRFFAPASSSGILMSTRAHTGSLASGAGSSSTELPHAASNALATSPTVRIPHGCPRRREGLNVVLSVWREPGR